MRRLRIGCLLSALALAALPALVSAENGFTVVSASDSNDTTTFPSFQTTVVICNYGTDEVYYRLFNSDETPAAATTSSAPLQAGSVTDPKCISFTHNTRSQKGLGWGAVSLICSAGETATVHLITQ
jgi:hypothetical protein